jgi:glycine cleavage system aminomethyltransferase T/NADPH-dependent 2,4-dienoyl-CoA reductase/sulfur reductase-like enzyme
VLTAGPEEPNALLTVGDGPAVIPNVPAPQLILRDGMVLRTQNRWPSLRYDLASLLQAGGGLFSAGFYYKTFIWPSWHAYEGLIRSLAGLGEAPKACNLPPVPVEHFSCDVLVAGGGPAGLTAARAAARTGARVVICEREPFFGGELEFESAAIEGLPAGQWFQSVVAELKALGVRQLSDTAVVGSGGGQVIAHAEPGGLAGRNTLYRIRPRKFVMAMGSTERPLVFVDNDRPGVMLLSAAERYLARYGVKVGQSVVIFANHSRAYAAALRLRAAGIQVRAVVDSRLDLAVGGRSAIDPGSGGESDPGALAARDELVRSGTECLNGYAVIAAKGGRTVTGAEVADRAGKSRSRVIACDAILMSGGWTPAMHAATQDGGVRKYVPDIAAFVGDEQPEWRVSIGAANGTLDLTSVFAEAVAIGRAAGRGAAAHGPNASTVAASVGQAAGADTVGTALGRNSRTGASPSDVTAPVAGSLLAIGDPPPALQPFWRADCARFAEKRQYVDFQNDVTVADLRTAVEEGFTDIEHAKRYTALGFGTDQARLSGALGAAIVGELQGKTLGDVGTSRLRQPYHPVTMRSLAGSKHGPTLRAERRTPLHDWHVNNGAVMESMGLWQRPRYYRENGDNPSAASIVEAKRVRATGGIADASTLGKIEINGPDAAAFLDYVYMTRASTLKVGRSRYGVNLREDGMVLDDGLILRLAPERFRVTTSSSHAGHMLSQFEFYRATDWGHAALALTDVTDAWAVIAVAGSASRRRLLETLDVESREAVIALKHMDFRTAQFAGAELQVLRATFSGELGFEIHCDAGMAVPMWQALITSGMQPYGLEAMDILRIEKGYLTHSELNGRTTPFDLGMQGLMKRDDNFVGRPLLQRPAFHEPTRPRLVGLRAVSRGARFLGGAQITTRADLNHACGFITSSTFSPTLNEWIGLGLVARSIAEGEELVARDPLRHGDTDIRVTSPVHFDAAGELMRQ